MSPDETNFWKLIQQSRTFNQILDGSAELGIQNWYFGAGFLAQTIWNFKSGLSENQFIHDVDWVYFDPTDISANAEARIERLVRDHFKNIPIRFDVKNQARVHLWYKEKFNDEILPYKSIHAAIETWPTTATAIGVTLSGDRPKIFAPYGLADLLTMTVRPNKKQITEAIYLNKVERWKRHWPDLKIFAWNES